jgi:hypothetical protein
MKMTVQKPAAIKRVLGVRFEREKSDIWESVNDSTFTTTVFEPDSVNIEFTQVDFDITPSKVLFFGTAPTGVGRLCSAAYTKEALNHLPEFARELVDRARIRLQYDIRGGTTPETTVVSYDRETRHKKYKEAMETAVYDYVKGPDQTFEDAKEMYGLDYAIEAWAAIAESDKENGHLYNEIYRLAMLAERQGEELERLKGVDALNQKMAAQIATTVGISGAVRGEVVKMGMHAYGILKKLDQEVTTRELHREPVFYTDDVRATIKGWNLLEVTSE